MRNTVWKFQFSFNILMCIIGYPTSLLYELRRKNKYNDAFVQRIDDDSFWLFFMGLYKDSRNVWYFYVTFTWLIAGAIFEKQSINWLSNRFGCNYYRLQKYVELDMRREGLRPKNRWENPNPEYKIDRYRKHYFYSDFDQLKARFENVKCEEEDHENE